VTRDKKIIRWIVIIIAVVVLWCLYNWGGNLLKPIAIKQIKEMTGARVDIENVRFKLSGKVELENIRIGPLVKQTPDNAILSARSLYAYFAPMSILKFKPQLERLRIEDFILNIQYNDDVKQWNILALKPPAAGRKKAELPELRFKQGEIKFTQVNNGQEIASIACRIRNGNIKTDHKNDLNTLTIAEDGATEKSGDRILITRTEGEKSQIQVDGRLPLLDLNLFGSKCNLNSFNSKITADKENIIFESTRFVIGPQTVIDVNGIIKDLQNDPAFVFGVKVKDLTVRYEPANNTFAHGSRIFEKFIPMLQVFFDYFNPQGLLDIDVILTGQAKQIAKTQCKGYLGCKDISIQYFQFPYLVEHLAGKIDVTENSMTMKDVKAAHGKVPITMNGYCGGFGETMDSRIVLSSNHMILDDDLYAALLEHHKRLWYIFAPAGVVSGDFIFTAKPPDIRKMEIYGDLLNVSIMCQYFPYPVKDITGKIALNGDLIELKNILSRRNGGTIKMEGRITKADTLIPDYDFQIQADNVAVDNELINAFPQEQKKFFSNFDMRQIKGDADIHIFSVDNNEMPVDYLAKLNIKGEQISHPLLPQPLRNITLDANLTPSMLEIESFKADFNKSPVDAAGTIWIGSGKEPIGYCMHLKTLDLILDSNLVRTVLGENSAKLLEDFQFKGTVNLDATIAKNAKINCPEFEVAVDCLSDTAVINKLNMPLRNITGRITVKPQILEFDSLSASPEGKIQPDENAPRIRLDGKINMTQQDVNSAELKLTATEMNFDESLTSVLGKMGKYYAELSPAGKFDLNFDKIKLYKNDANEKALLLDGTALFKNCSIGKNKPVSNIYAILDINAQYKIGGGLTNCQLLLNVQNASVKNRPFQNLKVPVIVDVNEQKIVVENFIGDFLGGKITGDAEAATDKEGKLTNYKVNMVLSGVNTESFVSPQTAGVSDTNGSIDGELNIQGDFQKPQIARGRLIAQAIGLKPIQKGIVAQIQRAIYEAMNKELAFDNVKIQAVIKGKIVYITTFDVYGPTVSMRGTGTYEPASDSININFKAYSAAGREGPPSFIESLTSGLAAAFLKVEMTGTLENPQIKVIPLPIIERSLEIIGTK
jgi:hypothetical protein